MAQIDHHWEKIVRPFRFLVEESSNTQYEEEITLEYFQPSFGVTLAHAVKRVLMSSLQGIAVTRVMVQGAMHEFDTLKGVKEDVMDIIHNIKGIHIGAFGENFPENLEGTLSATGPGEVCAKDVQWPSQVTVINGDHPIAVLDEGGKLSMTFSLERGQGYRAKAEQGTLPLGTIEVPALFNPVRHVHYEIIEQGDRQESIKFFIKTNGTISPKDALISALNILENSFQHMGALMGVESSKDGGSISAGSSSDVTSELDRYLNLKIEALSLSVRAKNCLSKMNMSVVRDVVSVSRKDLLSEPSLGEKTLKEIEAALETYGLKFGYFEEKETGL